MAQTALLAIAGAPARLCRNRSVVPLTGLFRFLQAAFLNQLIEFGDHKMPRDLGILLPIELSADELIKKPTSALGKRHKDFTGRWRAGGPGPCHRLIEAEIVGAVEHRRGC
jgi:hypothetical protein